VHLHIQLDIKNLAVEYIIDFLSLLNSGQPGARNSITGTSPSSERWL